MNQSKRVSQFPHADKSFPSKGSPWSTLKEACGTTPTEGALLDIARRSFLSLWSFPNVYTDEGRRGKHSDGKELCDLMVVFGNDILLFSDKACVFPSVDDLNLAWSRWYRRAVEKSARQLAGAENWIARFPTRVFLDAKCSKSLPVQFPPAEQRRIHLIAVTHGASASAIKHWNAIAPGSSGSLIIDTQIVGREHEDKPFVIGWPLESKRFVHVLDGETLALVLRELDTLNDFVDYLGKKQELMEASGCDFVITGEEELLAVYLGNIDPKTGEHRFRKPEPGHLVFLDEGHWNKLRASTEYRLRAQANEISYLWDQLIEYQASHVIHGSSELTMGETTKGSEEHLLRVMASENRLSRRMLGESIRFLRAKANEKIRATRCIVTPNKNRVFAMLALPYIPEQAHDVYRDYRQYLLYLYCQGAMLQFPEAQEILGVAFEHFDSETVSVDFLYMRLNGSQFDSADRTEITKHLRQENIWNHSTISGGLIKDAEFPSAS